MTESAVPSPYRLGTRRGLEASASARGTFAVLALDHRQNLRKEFHPEAPEVATHEEVVEFKRAVILALAPRATGSVLDPEIGAARCIADGSLPGLAGLLVAIEATGYAGEGRRRLERLVRLVDDEGRRWYERSNPVTAAPAPGDGWFRSY